MKSPQKTKGRPKAATARAERRAASNAEGKQKQKELLQKRTRSAFRRAAERRNDPKQLARVLAGRSDKTQTAFDRSTDRRRTDAQRLEEQKKQETTKQTIARVAELRRQRAKKAQDLRRLEIRREFARKAEDRHAREAATAKRLRLEQLQAAKRKAEADIERDQKRQRDDRIAAERRETDQARQRHKMERDSFRSNEIAAAARHHGAIRAIDNAEERAFTKLDRDHNSIKGRIAGLKPGSGKAREAAREEVRKDHEAQRLTKHRDLEALKERQFSGRTGCADQACHGAARTDAVAPFRP